MPAVDPAGPARDIDTIIEVMTQQVGRPLGDELIGLMRETMRPMSRQARADLAAAIDDCFERVESEQAGRHQATELMREPVTQGEALGSFSEALEWITARCSLETGDTSYLAKHLMLMSQPAMASAAERYVATWQAAAEGEPALHRRANAGRRAANAFLRGADQ
ncbi:hypothetical protein [Halomonas aquatica]|uniref:Uncharacterized protein n=1 Tax=Halomonas aquatica TaxID=3151123 RepID=A0ABV1NG96_9GAMM